MKLLIRLTRLFFVSQMMNSELRGELSDFGEPFKPTNPGCEIIWSDAAPLPRKLFLIIQREITAFLNRLLSISKQLEASRTNIVSRPPKTYRHERIAKFMQQKRRISASLQSLAA